MSYRCWSSLALMVVVLAGCSTDDSGSAGSVSDAAGSDASGDVSSSDAPADDTGSVDSQSADARPTDAQPTDAQPIDAQSTDIGGYCPGVDPWPEGVTLCATVAGCGQSFACDPFGPSNYASCGACLFPPLPCDDDLGCADEGTVCAPFYDECACGTGGSCTPACTESSCSDDEVCTEGHCLPQSCEDTWSCDTATSRCNASANGADQHGCEAIPCDETWSCDDGFRCDVGTGGSDRHGCVVIHCGEPNATSCEANYRCDNELPGWGCTRVICNNPTVCDCGSCVNGVCFGAPGVCVGPPPG